MLERINHPLIPEIFAQINNFADDIITIDQFCERYGEAPDEVRHYDVYLIQTKTKGYILKKTDEAEREIYQKYLKDKQLPVPAYYGDLQTDQGTWILLEQIAGHDVREVTDQIAAAAADSLSKIANAYWQQTDIPDSRFDRYWERINRRALAIKDDARLSQAYQLFIDRQKSCPRTLSNGDFLQWNALWTGREVKIIDWGFGGMMPYSLDIARFIAHGTEDQRLFPFYMTQAQKKIFVDCMYEKLIHKPERKQYILDIKLAVLNEYIEFIEADEDDNHDYYQLAISLAEDLLSSK